MNNVANYALLRWKIFSVKIRRCKIVDKYHVWNHSFNRWPSLEVHHWATILRFLTTIWILKSLSCNRLYNLKPHNRHTSRGGRSLLKIHFFIEWGLKMIQFKIPFKTKSRKSIPKNIHSIEYKIFKRTIPSKEFMENYSKFQ